MPSEGEQIKIVEMSLAPKSPRDKGSTGCEPKVIKGSTC